MKQKRIFCSCCVILFDLGNEYVLLGLVQIDGLKNPSGSLTFFSFCYKFTRKKKKGKKNSEARYVGAQERREMGKKKRRVHMIEFLMEIDDDY